MSNQPIDAAVDFMCSRFARADKLDEFRAKLTAALAIAVPNEGERGVELYVDYDPDEFLLAVLHACEIPCRGSFFSAEGIFLGTKFGVRVTATDARAKRGYGGDWTSLIK